MGKLHDLVNPIPLDTDAEYSKDYELGLSKRPSSRTMDVRVHRVEFDDSGSINCLPGREAAVETLNIVASSPYFVPDLVFTEAEEAAIIRTLDTRLFSWVLLTTFVLNMDRTNLSNAISDNLPEDLGFTINTVDTSITIYAILFALNSLVGGVIAHRVGPSRWIAILMFAWGLVTLAHAFIKDKVGFFIVRCFIGITEGGVIPATLVYLGTFYKTNELGTRLAWFWGIQAVGSAASGLMASGLLQLRGTLGMQGWKWLFLIYGIITILVAVATWFYLPRHAAETQGGIRGFHPWFCNKEIKIAVTRVIRDDPVKKDYYKPVTWSDFRDALSDLGLWGHLMITAIGLTPVTPLGTYLPTVIKSFKFNTFASNALTAPPYALQFISTILVIRHSDNSGERGYHGAFGAAWQLVGWIMLRSLPTGTNKGVKYLGALITESWPFTHPLNIAWMTENTGSMGKRTIASGAIIAFYNVSGAWASHIYRADDAPDFHRGNTINIVFAGVAMILWFVQKYAYRYVNAKRARRYNELEETDKQHEIATARLKANRSLLWIFTT